MERTNLNKQDRTIDYQIIYSIQIMSVARLSCVGNEASMSVASKD